MESFLNDYGLIWVGESNTESQIKTDVELNSSDTKWIEVPPTQNDSIPNTPKTPRDFQVLHFSYLYFSFPPMLMFHNSFLY